MLGWVGAVRVGEGPYDAQVPRPRPVRRVVVAAPVGRWSDADLHEVWRALDHRPHVFFRRAAPSPGHAPTWSVLASDPTEILTSEGRSSPRSADPFATLARRWPTSGARSTSAPPFAGGFAGYIGYEARACVEPSPPPRAPPDGFPGHWLGRYDAVFARDTASGTSRITGVGATRAEALAAVARMMDRLLEGFATAPRAPSPRRPGAPPPPRPDVSPAAYRRRVAEVRRRIGRGDLFQANVSQRFEGRFSGTAPRLFDRLTEASPSPFATYLDLGRGRAVLSSSPERFLRSTRGELETSPMKGTRPRGASAAEDRALARDLEDSAKDRAELAMIVDLARNDLARSCTPGTVRVRTPRRLEAYASVHQAVGVVSGRLREDCHPAEAVRRAFPPGSVTGAPKIEAMNVIDALEGAARGPYCGAIGWFDERGDFDLAVAIRTVCVAGTRVTYRVGGGVTWLSDPEAERVETLVKGAAMARAIAGGAR